MKLNKSELDMVKEYIIQIIREECDGTYSSDINRWSISNPEFAPANLKRKLLLLIDSITDVNNI